MELTRDQDEALLLLSDNVATKLKPMRSEIHPIKKLKSICSKYKHLFSQLLANENRFFEYYRMSSDTCCYFILSKPGLPKSGQITTKPLFNRKIDWFLPYGK